MIRRFIPVVVLAAALVTANAATKNPVPPVRLMSGLGEVHHPVSTKNREAQQFFDQGFKFVYGLNHDEARRSFQRAAELDPKLAMAHWGVALTLGPNYNLPVDPERERIEISLTKDQIEHSKSIDTADIALDEVLPTIWVM